MANNKKFRLQTLLYNKKFLIGFSFLMALVIWIAVTLNESPVIEKTIKDVPVEIDMSVPKQLGYETFGDTKFKVDVTVKGKRYLLGDNVLDADDIKVVALTSQVGDVGKYILQLKATPKNSNSGFKVISKSMEYVDVYFDIPKKVEMTISPKITVKDELLESNEYIEDTTVLSRKKAVLSGPATEINRVKEVQAKVTVDKPLNSTETFQTKLDLYDGNGSQDFKYINIESGENVSVTIPVYKKAKMTASVEFTNAPNDYQKNSLGIKSKPNTINIAAPENAISGLSSICVGKVDFSKISNIKNKFTFYSKDFTGFKLLDNIESVSVEIDASNMKRKTVDIDTSKISLLNQDNRFNISLSKVKLNGVAIIGPENALENISSDNIEAKIDLSEVQLKKGKNYVNVPLILSSDKCWIYGKYSVQIICEEK